ncbi:class I SAM-dependent methyltransferase [Hylemonella sp. W303a]|uniref:class I SAM-dependent methyltransferase n=1 Tax=Hylemonella sp. W303a TaxID=3389873 RepID=UPI00396AF1B5
MSERIERFVESMNIQPGDRVLEIGCGHGLAATLVCQRLKTGRFVAIDRSGKMVAAAAQRNKGYVEAGVARFLESTLEQLDLGDERFDKIFAMRVRLFHDQPELACELAQRWLTAHGTLYVQYDEPGQTPEANVTIWRAEQLT